MFGKKKPVDTVEEELLGALEDPDPHTTAIRVARLLHTKGAELEELGIPVEDLKPRVSARLRDLGKTSAGYTEADRDAGRRVISDRLSPASREDERAMQQLAGAPSGPADVDMVEHYQKGKAIAGPAVEKWIDERMPKGTNAEAAQRASEAPDDPMATGMSNVSRARLGLPPLTPGARESNRIAEALLKRAGPGVARGLFNLGRGAAQFAVEAPVELGMALGGGDSGETKELVKGWNPTTPVAKWLADAAMATSPEGRLTLGGVAKHFIDDPAGGTEAIGMAATAGSMAAKPSSFLKGRRKVREALTREVAAQEEAAKATAKLEEARAKKQARLDELDAETGTQVDRDLSSFHDRQLRSALDQQTAKLEAEALPPDTTPPAESADELFARRAQEIRAANPDQALAEDIAGSRSRIREGRATREMSERERSLREAIAGVSPDAPPAPDPSAEARAQELKAALDRETARRAAETPQVAEAPVQGPPVGPEVQFLGEEPPQPAPGRAPKPLGPTPLVKKANQVPVAKALAGEPVPEIPVSPLAQPPKPVTGGKAKTAPTPYGMHKGGVIKELYGAMMREEISPETFNGLKEKVSTLKDTPSIKKWVKTLPEVVRDRMTAQGLAQLGLGTYAAKALWDRYQGKRDDGIAEAAIAGLMGFSHPENIAGLIEKLKESAPDVELTPAAGPGPLEMVEAGAAGITNRPYTESGLARTAVQMRERNIGVVRHLEDTNGGRAHEDAIRERIQQLGPGAWNIVRKQFYEQPLTRGEELIRTQHPEFQGMLDEFRALKSIDSKFEIPDETRNPMDVLRDARQDLADAATRHAAMPQLQALLKQYETARDHSGVSMVKDFIDQQVYNRPNAMNLRVAETLQKEAHAYRPSVGDEFKVSGRRNLAAGKLRVTSPVLGSDGKQIELPDKGPLWRVEIDGQEWPSPQSTAELGMLKLDGKFAGGIRASSRPLSKIIRQSNMLAALKVIWGAPRVVVNQLLDNPSRLVGGVANVSEVAIAMREAHQAARDHYDGKDTPTTRELEAIGVLEERPDPRRAPTSSVGKAAEWVKAKGFRPLQFFESRFSATAYLAVKKALGRMHPEWTEERIRHEAAIESHRMADAANPALAGTWDSHPAYQLVGFLGRSGVRSTQHFLRLAAGAIGSTEGKKKLAQHLVARMGVPAAIVGALGLTTDDGIELYLKNFPVIGMFTGAAMAALQKSKLIKVKDKSKRPPEWLGGGEGLIPTRGPEIMASEGRSLYRLGKKALGGKMKWADVRKTLPMGTAFTQFIEDGTNFITDAAESARRGQWYLRRKTKRGLRRVALATPD